MSKFTHQSIAGMNSVLDLVLIEVSETIATEICRTVKQDVFRLEKLLSRFDREGETFAVNQTAQHRWTSVSDELWDILQECERFKEQTLGYFNIGLGHFKGKAGATLKSLTGEELGYMKPQIEYDHNGRSIRFANRFTSLDFGAIGKGFLLKKLKSTLADFGVANCFVSFGGSSILTKGKHPSGNAWPVSFRNGKGNQQVFHLNDHTVSISGARQGKQQCYHIVNPNTLKFEIRSRLAVVQDECPVRAEVLSTALVAANKSEFEEITSQFKPQKINVFNQPTANEGRRIYEHEN
ncbi:FAD:protein FMN transferase [Mangrovibacterium diazotrophicum]|uniref:FAD:protein FMN transferase n=1 Tax=Mangrovibacterium diazotrophicum TaxID=1261403 RepID=A0A419W4F5_9BACT|nr:FAD:protein FMN transferase [Mangrovibacterium diazotrophicum]RKD90322.1 thiamine biosynthesis lipoprotein ApbE [Mangrovibacterium diazotrophicum]